MKKIMKRIHIMYLNAPLLPDSYKHLRKNFGATRMQALRHMFQNVNNL